MKLEILTPEKKIFNGEVDIVTLPGTKGSFQVLANHAPLVSSLSQGKIKINQNNTITEFRIIGGVAEVLNNSISVLAEGIY